jgi:hypothetical protein
MVTIKINASALLPSVPHSAIGGSDALISSERVGAYLKRHDTDGVGWRNNCSDS